jgi:hypothetical protein
MSLDFVVMFELKELELVCVLYLQFHPGSYHKHKCHLVRYLQLLFSKQPEVITVVIFSGIVIEVEAAFQCDFLLRCYDAATYGSKERVIAAGTTTVIRRVVTVSDVLEVTAQTHGIADTLLLQLGGRCRLKLFHSEVDLCINLR